MRYCVVRIVGDIDDILFELSDRRWRALELEGR